MADLGWMGIGALHEAEGSVILFYPKEWRHFLKYLRLHNGLWIGRGGYTFTTQEVIGLHPGWVWTHAPEDEPELERRAA